MPLSFSLLALVKAIFYTTLTANDDSFMERTQGIFSTDDAELEIIVVDIILNLMLN